MGCGQLEGAEAVSISLQHSRLLIRHPGRWMPSLLPVPRRWQQGLSAYTWMVLWGWKLGFKRD